MLPVVHTKSPQCELNIKVNLQFCKPFVSLHEVIVDIFVNNSCEMKRNTIVYTINYFTITNHHAL